MRPMKANVAAASAATAAIAADAVTPPVTVEETTAPVTATAVAPPWPAAIAAYLARTRGSAVSQTRRSRSCTSASDPTSGCWAA